MIKKTRYDGTLIEGLHHYTRITPYVLTDRIGSTIYFEQEFDVTHSLEYLEMINKDRTDPAFKVKFFEVFLTAMARTIALRPDLNRFISGFNYYQRKRILLNFVAKKEMTDEGEEIQLTVPFSPYETLASVQGKMKKTIREGKEGKSTEGDKANIILMKMPRFVIRGFFKLFEFLDFHNMAPAELLKSDPMYCTAFITNVGSIGVDAPFHHNFEHGTCGIFIALGKVKKSRTLDENGTLQERDVVKVTFTYDDRIKDGIYCARAIDLFKNMVENPEQLEGLPELTEKNMDRLNLIDFPSSTMKEQMGRVPTGSMRQDLEVSFDC